MARASARRACLFFAASLVTLSAPAWADDLVASVALRGCWRNVDTVAVYENGKSVTSRAQCARFYAERSIFAACFRPDSKMVETMEFAYELESPATYRQHLVTPLPPAVVASYVKPNEFTIDGDTLSVVSYPTPAASAPGRSLVRMTGRFVRSVPADRPQAECRPDRLD